MRTRLPTACILLAACGTTEAPGPAQAPDTSPLQPTSAPAPVPAPVSNTSAPHCPVYFTGDDANLIFGAVGTWSTDPCVFDGVTVRGSTLLLTWKTPAETTVKLHLAPAGCSVGEPIGAYRTIVEQAVAERCPGVLPALKSGLSSDDFPLPTGTHRDEVTGPDGGGAPGAAVGADLPPRVAPGPLPPGTPARD